MAEHKFSTLLSGLKSWRKSKDPAISSQEKAIKLAFSQHISAHLEQNHNLKADIRISQIECTDIHCPGLETIILIMSECIKTQALKIKKPLEEVTIDDINEALIDFKN